MPAWTASAIRARTASSTGRGRPAFLAAAAASLGNDLRYRIAVGGALTPLGGTPAGQTGSVGAFAVHDGDLTELANSPTSLPGPGTAGIVVT